YWEGRRTWSSMVSAIRHLTRHILVGFAFAVKHYLREEEGNKCEDVRPFISDIKSSLPGFINLKEQDAAEKNKVQNKKDW
ncbi:3660_t:CDS:2, partial [Racocetra fulgida]